MSDQFRSVKEYLFYLQTRAIYSFTIENAFSVVNKSQTAIKREIARLSKERKVRSIRRGFYVIVPPEYAVRGTRPVDLFIDDLMKYLNRAYYISLLSAGQLHGAAHQKTQISYVTTTLPALRDIRRGSIGIVFTSIKNWPPIGIIEKKTSAGMIKVSSPALTALDLVRYQKTAGYLNRVSTVLEELAEEVTAADLEQVVPTYPSLNAIQRLGYLWDNVLEHKGLANVIYKIVGTRIKEYVPLYTNIEKKGPYIPKWKIVENVTIETDL